MENFNGIKEKQLIMFRFGAVKSFCAFVVMWTGEIKGKKNVFVTLLLLSTILPFS
jgi:hypothetical protein